MVSDEPVRERPPIPFRGARPLSAEAALARLGMTAATAVPSLRTLGMWGDDGPVDDAWPVVEALARSPNPHNALPTLARLAERDPQAWEALVAGERQGQGLVARAARVAGASRSLGELLASDPGALRVLSGDLQPWHAAIVQRRAQAELIAKPADPARTLAGFQRRGLLRVAARDLLGLADTPTTAGELADLAEGILAAVLDHVAAELEPNARVSVIGMGKLGGRELNYVSDVDVMFVGEGDFDHARRVVERFMRVLGETTPEGRAYEVDANLRPEGEDGPLVRSIEAYRGYYERWAKTWEFQALLKARHVAGDVRLGRDFVELTRPYVWPDRWDANAVAEIQRMKSAVEGSRPVRRVGRRQVKLAPGGLRDIEFAVQLLQLVHGRYDDTLRSGNTLEALEALAAGGYVDEGDANLFNDAYQFLRTVEHRLQLARLRRTHTLPADDDERGELARNLGFRTLRHTAALEQFDREFARVQGYVRRLHEKLFYRPLLERFAELSREEQVALGTQAGLNEVAARDRLAALGFADPDAALRHLDALATGVTRRAQLFRTLLPAILPTLAQAPDPDGGLAAFRSLADRLGNSPVFLRTLRDTPPVGELLAQVLGRSSLVGDWLQRQPEVFGYLADLSGLARTLEAADYLRLADGLRRRGQKDAAAADALRRLKRREVARIAVRDLSGQAGVDDVAAELTALAEACLERGLSMAVSDDVRFAVVALGKLGGAELGYASDLDVLLVFEPAEQRDEALRAAGRLLGLLGDITPEGSAFRVDANLRPEGKDGPLARTLDSYRSYYQRWGEHWELQALTQARPVAGDLELGQQFVDSVVDLVYPERPSAERLQAVRRMKARVERERGGSDMRTRRTPTTRRMLRPDRLTGTRLRDSRAGPPAERRASGNVGERVDLKTGPGGLIDVEWTVQMLQLQHGGQRPALRRQGSAAAIDALEHEGLLEQADAGWLREGRQMLSHVRNMLYLGGFRRTDQLPPGPREQERVARLLGYASPGAQALAEDLRRVMRRVRKVHERYFYDA